MGRRTKHAETRKPTVRFINWSGFQYSQEFETKVEARAVYERAIAAQTWKQVHIENA